MRLVTFDYQQKTRIGCVIQRFGHDYVLDLSRKMLGASMIDFLEAGEEALLLADQLCRQASRESLIPLADVALKAPIPRPGKILCLGHNYQDHTSTSASPEYPTIFGKTANTVCAPGEVVTIPPVTRMVDYEAELAVVIGRRGKAIQQENAYDFVAGYTIFNDVSARDYQKRTTQWMLGKSFDGFGPMGPWIVTRDEIPDVHCLELSAGVDGFEEQRTNTRQMIFTIPFLVAYLSQVITLEVGDIISTGTPGRKQRGSGEGPVYLKDGEVVTIRIEGIGELVTPFRVT
jgi:acylpyruvate hydrolase